MPNILIHSKAGSRHRQLGMDSQDAVYTAASDRVAAVCLCDGAGFSSYSQYASQEVSRICVRMLLPNFHRYMTLDIADIKNELIASIYNALEKISAGRNISVSDLASTILAAAMDEAGNMFFLHLGDGAILWNHMNRYEFVSFPENSLIENSTYLTMNGDWESHLRIYRTSRTDIRHVMLMTDGAFGILSDQVAYQSAPSSINQAFREYAGKLDYSNPSDDYSLVIIHNS